MTMLRLFFLCLLLSGCAPMPTGIQISRDLQMQLDRSFGGQLLEVVALERQGSVPDRDRAGRRIVYFRLLLRLRQPYDFGAWDTRNVNRLAALIGCGSRGLYGLRVGGNRAGDRLRAFGRAVYRRTSAGWEMEATPEAATAMPPAGIVAPPGMVERLARALTTAVHGESGPRLPASDHIVEEELVAALQNIKTRLARVQQDIAFASGQRGGEYWRIGEAMASLRGNAPPIFNIASSGSVANLALLNDGTASVAIVQADVLQDAVRGTGVFAGRGPDAGLRLLAQLYPEAIHIVVRAEYPVRTVVDLRGKRLAVGSTDPGVRQTVLKVLRRHGLTPAGGLKIESMSLRDAVALLAAGRIDAIVHTIGVPSADLEMLARSRPVRFLPLDGNVIRSIRDESPAYLAFTIPAGSYGGQPKPVATLAVPALLVARETLPDDHVRKVLQALYLQADLTVAGSHQGGLIPHGATWQPQGPVPMHRAAMRFFDEAHAAGRHEPGGQEKRPADHDPQGADAAHAPTRVSPRRRTGRVSEYFSPESSRSGNKPGHR